MGWSGSCPLIPYILCVLLCFSASAGAAAGPRASSHYARVSNVPCEEAPSTALSYAELSERVMMKAGIAAVGHGTAATTAALKSPTTVRLPLDRYNHSDMKELGFDGGVCCIRAGPGTVVAAFSGASFNARSWDVQENGRWSGVTRMAGRGASEGCVGAARSLAMYQAPHRPRSCCVNGHSADSLGGDATPINVGFHSLNALPGMAQWRSLAVDEGMQAWLYNQQTPAAVHLKWIALESIPSLADIGLAPGQLRGVLVVPKDAALLFSQCNFMGAATVVPFGTHLRVADAAPCASCVGQLRRARVRSALLPPGSEIAFWEMTHVEGGNTTLNETAHCTTAVGHFGSIELRRVPLPPCGELDATVQAEEKKGCPVRPVTFVNMLWQHVMVVATGREKLQRSLAIGQAARLQLCRGTEYFVATSTDHRLKLRGSLGMADQTDIVIASECNDPTPVSPVSYAVDAGVGRFSIDVGTPGPHTSKGGNQDVNVAVELGMLWKPLQLKANLQRVVTCPLCHGKGGDASSLVTCPTCNKTGLVERHDTLARSELLCPAGASRQGGGGRVCEVEQVRRVTCPRCEGHGTIVKHGHGCARCGGTRTVPTTQPVDVSFEAGASEHATFVVPGMGSEKPFTTPGDIVFRLRITPHDNFTRAGQDIANRQNISLPEALAGFSREIKLPNGTVLDVGQSGITQPNFNYTFSGFGLPYPKEDDAEFGAADADEHEAPDTPTRYGDLLVEYFIQYPENLTRTRRKRVRNVFDGLLDNEVEIDELFGVDAEAVLDNDDEEAPQATATDDGVEL